MDVIELCERGLIPDVLTRYGMRNLIAQRLKDEGNDDGEMRSRRFNRLLADLRAAPIAIETKAANATKCRRSSFTGTSVRSSSIPAAYTRPATRRWPRPSSTCSSCTLNVHS